MDGEKPELLRERLYPEKEGVYEKALVWAYFRIPFAAAMITGGLAAYGLMGVLPCLSSFGLDCDPSINRLGALLAALCLWSFPNPKKSYWEECNPHEAQKAGWWDRWRPRRSILAHLVTGAVEWRRVLLQLSQDCASEKLLSMAKKGFWGNAWKRYLLGTFLFLLFILGRVVIGEMEEGPAKNILKQVAEVGIIISPIYLMVMVYVAKVFENAKKTLKGF